MEKYQKPHHNTQRSRFRPPNTNQRVGTSNSDPASIPPLPESLLDIDGLCQLLNLGKTKISWLIHREGLPLHKFGKAYRFDRTEVWQWLQNRRDLM
jgi:excisionase family DNA binding protein